MNDYDDISWAFASVAFMFIEVVKYRSYSLVLLSKHYLLADVCH